jgi:hypothetical protein
LGSAGAAIDAAAATPRERFAALIEHAFALQRRFGAQTVRLALGTGERGNFDE